MEIILFAFGKSRLQNILGRINNLDDKNSSLYFPNLFRS